MACMVSYAAALAALILVMFVSTRPPMVLCLLLIGLSLPVSSLFFIIMSKWLAYSISLIFLGGMMVVFLYVSSMALNDKIIVGPAHSLLAYAPVGLAPLLISSPFWCNAPVDSPLSQFYQEQSCPLVLFLICYLLSTLFIVVKSSESFKGALAKKWE